MDVYLVNGLPTHPLFVHGAVVLVPLTALALVVCAAWPGAARRLSWGHHNRMPPSTAIVAPLM